MERQGRPKRTQVLKLAALLAAAAIVCPAADNHSAEYTASLARVYNVVVTARTVRDYFNERQAENQAANQRTYEGWLKSYNLTGIETLARKALPKGEFKRIEDRARNERASLFKIFDTLGPRLTTYPKFLEQTDTFHLEKKIPDDLKRVTE